MGVPCLNERNRHEKKIVPAALFPGDSHWCERAGFAVKTNLLYDATLTANAGIEAGIAPRWTFDLSGNYNAWPVNGHKWKHAMVQPEARYWFCDRFAGHFVGAHVLGGIYNVGQIKNNLKFLGTDFSKLTDNRYQGWAVGAGVAYGYAYILGQHWNLEFELGFGYVYSQYDQFECVNCGRKIGEGDHHYIGPTKAAVNLVFVF